MYRAFQCTVCAVPIRARKRIDCRYCGVRCRVKAHRIRYDGRGLFAFEHPQVVEHSVAVTREEASLCDARYDDDLDEVDAEWAETRAALETQLIEKSVGLFMVDRVLTLVQDMLVKAEEERLAYVAMGEQVRAENVALKRTIHGLRDEGALVRQEHAHLARAEQRWRIDAQQRTAQLDVVERELTAHRVALNQAQRHAHELRGALAGMQQEVQRLARAMENSADRQRRGELERENEALRRWVGQARAELQALEALPAQLATQREALELERQRVTMLQLDRDVQRRNQAAQQAKITQLAAKIDQYELGALTAMVTGLVGVGRELASAWAERKGIALDPAQGGNNQGIAWQRAQWTAPMYQLDMGSEATLDLAAMARARELQGRRRELREWRR